MTLKMHSENLAAGGLFLVNPTDPGFDEKVRTQIRVEPWQSTDYLRSFSVLFENHGSQTVVAYMLQWCFHKRDGPNKYCRKAFIAPRALMEGETPTTELAEQNRTIRPGSARLLSLMDDPDQDSVFPIPITGEEGERFLQGIILDTSEIIRRSELELAKYTDVAVSIDGAFFEDGVFIGEDTTDFFAQTTAHIQAKRDLLNELVALATAGKSVDDVFRRVEAVANERANPLTPKSTPSDFYNYHRQFYAKGIMRMRNYKSDEEVLTRVLQPTKKPWRLLVKRQAKESY